MRSLDTGVGGPWASSGTGRRRRARPVHSRAEFGGRPHAGQRGREAAAAAGAEGEGALEPQRCHQPATTPGRGAGLCPAPAPRAAGDPGTPTSAEAWRGAGAAAPHLWLQGSAPNRQARISCSPV